MRTHELNGQGPTPCCLLLFVSLVVIPTSISTVDVLLVVKHACMHACMHMHMHMHMRKYESNGQAPTPCCFLLFLSLVLASKESLLSH
jgi:heme/copper-type cytochrome/quinol oxidase subunit 4